MNDNEKNILSKSLNIEGNDYNNRMGGNQFNKNVNHTFNTHTNLYKGSPVINKNPFGMTFENENYIRHHEKIKYKEDLDYLINLKRQMNEDEFEKRYGNEFRRKVQLMNEKQEQLEIEKKYLDYLNYQNYLENQKKLEQKLKAKNETLTDLDHFYQKKNIEEQLKKADVKLSQKLMEEESQRITGREMEYRNKINSMNDKIYEHGQKFTDLVKINNSPQLNELFHLRDDHQFNRKLAEMRSIEKENVKKDPTQVNERLKELERDREINNKMKMEKLDHQKLYKDYLDFQYKLENEKKQYWKAENSNELHQLMMPSYDYPNRAVPTAKKANDTIDWVKNNHTETLRNGKNYYLGDTKLRHNPITQPVEDMGYNKYLNKQRIMYGVHPNMVNVSNPHYFNNSLAHAGNNILI